MSATNEDVDSELENDMEEVMNNTPHSTSANVESTRNASNVEGTSMSRGGYESARCIVRVLLYFAIHLTF